MEVRCVCFPCVHGNSTPPFLCGMPSLCSYKQPISFEGWKQPNTLHHRAVVYLYYIYMYIRFYLSEKEILEYHLLTNK